MSDNPICCVCNEKIEVSNPLEMKEGFFHRTCWLAKTAKEIGN